jgi:hypothetical protein
MRQLIDMTAKIAQQLVNYQRYEALIQTIADILKSELPERRVEIQQKLSSLSSSMREANYLPSAESQGGGYS